MKKRVALLEDDADIRELVIHVLTEADMEVHCYGRAKDFWENIHAVDAHLVLLDIMVPDGDGLDICHRLNSVPTTAHLPVILMSAAHSNIDYMRYGAKVFISKPFNIDDLIETIRTHLYGVR